MVPATVARQSSEPSARAIDPLGRMPASPRWTRAATTGAKRRTTSTGAWSAMMSQAAGAPTRSRAGSGGSNGPRCDRDVADPLDLERPHRVPGLVPADQVQRVGLERRLDQVRPHRPPGAPPPRARSAPARTRSSTTRRSAHALVSRWTWSLKPLVARAPWTRTSRVRSTCSAERRRQDLPELLERRRRGPGRTCRRSGPSAAPTGRPPSPPTGSA